MSHQERRLLDRYRALSPVGRETVRSVVDALCAYRDELAQSQPERETRLIPLYRSPAAAGFAAPVPGEDFDMIPVESDVPPAAEYAVRIQGDSMEPVIADGSVAYVNHDPLAAGDVGIFCVDGGMLCKQYYRDPLGIVYLFSLNRKRADADVVLTVGGGRSLACFGRVMVRAQPLPDKA
jgi:SOS-response transcriptional repressor LexA